MKSDQEENCTDDYITSYTNKLYKLKNKLQGIFPDLLRLNSLENKLKKRNEIVDKFNRSFDVNLDFNLFQLTSYSCLSQVKEDILFVKDVIIKQSNLSISELSRRYCMSKRYFTKIRIS